MNERAEASPRADISVSTRICSRFCCRHSRSIAACWRAGPSPVFAVVQAASCRPDQTLATASSSPSIVPQVGLPVGAAAVVMAWRTAWRVGSSQTPTSWAVAGSQRGASWAWGRKTALSAAATRLPAARPQARRALARRPRSRASQSSSMVVKRRPGSALSARRRSRCNHSGTRPCLGGCVGAGEAAGCWPWIASWRATANEY